MVPFHKPLRLRVTSSGRHLRSPVQKALLQDTTRTCFFHFKDFNRAVFGSPSNPPDTLTDDSFLEEGEEGTREVDTQVAVPLEQTHPLDIGGYLLRVQLLNVLQYSVCRSITNIDLRHAEYRG